MVCGMKTILDKFKKLTTPLHLNPECDMPFKDIAKSVDLYDSSTYTLRNHCLTVKLCCMQTCQIDGLCAILNICIYSYYVL